MRYRAFEIPEHYSFVDTLGIAPELVENEAACRLTFDDTDGDELVVTLDQPGRSAHVLWLHRGIAIMEIFREGAVGVRLTANGTTSALAILFETEDLKGELDVQVAPSFEIRDQLLLR